MLPTSDDKPTNPDRQQTDESLRVEREEADEAIGEKLAAIDETVDAIILPISVTKRTRAWSLNALDPMRRFRCGMSF